MFLQMYDMSRAGDSFDNFLVQTAQQRCGTQASYDVFTHEYSISSQVEDYRGSV
jgi:hypothetical protein